jgi:hypothetical protein
MHSTEKAYQYLLTRDDTFKFVHISDNKETRTTIIREWHSKYDPKAIRIYQICNRRHNKSYKSVVVFKRDGKFKREHIKGKPVSLDEDVLDALLIDAI